MAPVTASPRNDPDGDGRDLALRWTGQISLTQRILAVNIIALALVAGAFFYLDSFRSRMLDSRVEQASREVMLAAEAIAAVRPGRREPLLLRLAGDTGTRVRVYGNDGELIVDTRALGLRNAVLLDPDKDPWDQVAARLIDATIDRVVGADRAPLYRERAAWPDVVLAGRTGEVSASVWRAPDRTPVITAAAPLRSGGVVMTTANARDLTQRVRVERFRLSIVLALVVIVSVLLSLFLARTIVRPLRHLARAAILVRLGRAREVVVPRLPSRRDELGLLARALSDMSQALRARIDATEAFAADVTHELKNPLASLRSAVEGLETIADPELRRRLIGIVREDVHRLDRLITDISEASRLDAQLSRAELDEVDLARLIDGLLAQRATRGIERDVRIDFDHDPDHPLVVLGEGARLERVFENLLDNALSFSPDGGRILITAWQEEDLLAIAVEDEGPGVPKEEREAIFRRFQSVRPNGEAFGQHSGLGLAIARAIVEAHGGAIIVEERPDRANGARFVVRLPLAAAS